jgi:hypothetical protein
MGGEAVREPDPRFVPFNEAVAYAHVPPGTMRDWIRRGVLPAYRIGPRLLQVDLNDIDALRRRLPTGRAAQPASGRRRRTA